ncbi:phosphate ABC transporter substrate-binding protein PstS [Subtercola endophyticus]|uniref:phosphate ABC transporter substrate-binding protein PstS n=1 Tax=Subtercola endophyticus TaxID=2895559 RepID=UPI001E37F0CA|nr:phosphate ABC transporter substrate-binding protein PstS [Subtercola endophyticus]UFS57493.1 phosphate ABC transporter substrate-binding protein PstS [Subtercola endophyticus]
MAVTIAGLLVTMGAASATPAFAETYVPISGSGSTWSQNAVEQWRTHVATNYGMTVNYSGTGSSAGRQDFINGAVDFAISELPFQAHPEDGSAPEVPSTAYTYVPIVAGGTSLMYHLTINGKRVTDLRLDGQTITKIFTGVVTNWNDPVIQSANPGLTMPDKPITPVLRADGSGSTAQFTQWMADQQPSLWSDFCASVDRPVPCGSTTQYPGFGGAKLQNGSLGVAGYVSQDYGEGAIAYVENSYALQSGFPVVKVLNAAGYYVEPTAPAVSVALLGATVASDLTQQLGGVYDNADTRAYPLSYYSYMIVPTKVGGIFTAEKGRTLGAFVSYAVCEGQQKEAALGYAPLPLNLVRAASDQLKRIPGAPAGGVDLATCNNPALTILNTAPQPPACAKQGPTQCLSGDSSLADFSTTSRPSIVGTARVGQAIAADAGVWSPAPDSIDYQWLRAGTPIPGATAQLYSPTVGDYGASLSVNTTAHKAGYKVVTTASAPTSAVGWDAYFADVGPANPFYAHIQWMAAERLSTGNAQPTGLPLFAPTEAVSRQAMAAFLYRYSGETFVPPATPSFSDVSAANPFFTAVEWMHAKHITNGNADGTFAPTDSVTRQSMAAFLHRYSGASSTLPATASFSDVSSANPFYADIEWMKSTAITTGNADGTYTPLASVSRQAMAAFLSRMNAAG